MNDKIIKQITSPGKSPLITYKEMHVGRAGWLFFLYYELCLVFLKNLQGALGLALRSVCYKPLLGTMGKGVVIGPGVTLRNPRMIHLGDHVVVDENSVLDAKGEDSRGIVLGHHVFVSKNVILSCKSGAIIIGDYVSIGPFCGIYSIDACEVRIGDYCVIAAYCYFAGGGAYITTDPEMPFMLQGLEEGRPIVVEANVWLGGYVAVMEGVTIGTGSVIGAKSLVKSNMPPQCVAFGVPAKVYRTRGPEGDWIGSAGAQT